MAEEQPQGMALEDQYDLGDTERNLREETRVVIRDPATGRFLPPDSVIASPNPATVQQPPAAPEPAPPPAHQYLIDQAVELGFKESDLEGMSPPAISRAIFATLKQQAAFRAQQADARVLQDAATAQRPPIPAAAPAPEPDEFAEALGPDYATNYDPALVNLLKKERADRKALEKRLADREQQETVKEQSRAAQLLDDHFEALGPEYHELFGKEPANDLAAKKAIEMDRRIMVLNKAGVNLQNVTPKSLAKIKAAADLLFKIKPEAKPAEASASDPYSAAGAKPRVTVEQWNGAGLARPTQRNGAAEPKGEEKAVANLKAKMAEAGLLEGGDGEVMEGLLG